MKNVWYSSGLDRKRARDLLVVEGYIREPYYGLGRRNGRDVEPIDATGLRFIVGVYLPKTLYVPFLVTEPKEIGRILEVVGVNDIRNLDRLGVDILLKMKKREFRELEGAIEQRAFKGIRIRGKSC
jgi:hypothetical protein